MSKPNRAPHRARKRFGQHFLTDRGVIDGIVRAIAPQADDILIEIGPGLQALTHGILQALPDTSTLTVVELDRDLAARLRHEPRLHVIEQDALKVDFGQIARDMPQKNEAAETKLRIVGNLPYNISSPLLFHLMNYADVVQDHVFMLQKEVVDRMVATPATKAYGRLSVMLQWRYSMQSVLDVPPEAFDPPPKVMSAVVAMQPKRDYAAVDTTIFTELVRVAFSQRRKLLRHSLGKWLTAREYTGNFDLQRRAEEVAPEEYVQLALDIADATTHTNSVN